MSDPIFSPDGKMVYVDGEWVAKDSIISINDSVVTGNITINTSKTDEDLVENLFDLAIDCLSRQDMAGALDAFREAKKINVKLANSVFEVERKLELAEAYTDLSAIYCEEIQEMRVTDKYESGFEIIGDSELRYLLNKLDIAVNNALHYFESIDALLLICSLVGDNDSLHLMNSSLIDKKEVDLIAKLGYVCLLSGKVASLKCGEVIYSTQLTFKKWRSELDPLKNILGTIATELITIGASLITKSAMVGASIEGDGEFDLNNFEEEVIFHYWDELYPNYVREIKTYEDKGREQNKKMRRFANSVQKRNSQLLSGSNLTKTSDKTVSKYTEDEIFAAFVGIFFGIVGIVGLFGWVLSLLIG